MNPKKISFKPLEHSKYAVYWKKAQDFYSSMSVAYGSKNWHSAGLESVHCAISSTDALLVYKKGVRCTSQDHRELVDFLIEQLDNDESRKYSDTLTKIIGMKNIIEYEDRIFTEKEASEIFKRTERYYTWIKSQIP